MLVKRSRTDSGALWHRPRDGSSSEIQLGQTLEIDKPDQNRTGSPLLSRVAPVEPARRAWHSGCWLLPLAWSEPVGKSTACVW